MGGVHRDRDHPVLQWLLEVSATIPTVTIAGSDMSGPTAAALGWEALRDALHFRGVRSREDLAEQIHAMGFPMSAHFSGRAQERILSQAIAVDARVSVLESLFVRLTLAECHRGQVPFPARGQQGLRMEPTTQDCTFRSSRRPHPMLEQFPESSWSVLDDVELCSRNGSRRCRVAHNTSVEGFDKHAAKHWKQDAMRPILGTS